jgi:hypothetical protein
MNKFSELPSRVMRVETLNLSRSIISGKVKLAQLEMGLSIQDTFSNPTIRSVFKSDNGAIAFGVVNVLVTRFVSSFGFSTKPSDDQIESLTVDTLENFGYESLEDVILFFKMARTGKFGTTKRGVDSNLIFGEWFPSYLEKKAVLREESYEIHKNKKESKHVTIDQVQMNYRKATMASLKGKNKKFVDDFVKDMDRQMLEDTISSWANDKELQQHVALLKSKRRIIKK